MNAKTKTVMN